MKSIQIFDPVLCCSTGVCGVEVDQKLVTFAADIDWAQQNGARIERFNLGQQPMAFVENAAAKAFLETSGQDALPLVLVDGAVEMSGRYPTRAELADWSGITVAPSIFNDQVATLVAIGAAIAANCEPCFKFHFDKGRKLGVSAADMRRAVDLAQKVKDSPAKSVAGLAQRLLDEGPASTSAEPETKTKATCCAPSTGDAAKPASKCC
jgi:AhpD family alkylhydroperoxidase